MEGKKNLCAMISTDLHTKIMAEKEQLELNASKTGLSCSSRFSYRSSGVSSANACSSLKSREQ